MNVVDGMFVAAIIAASMVTFFAIYSQKKWRLYNLLVGKKSAFSVHVLVVCLLALQTTGVGVLVARSTWSFSPIIPLGLALIVFALWLYVRAVQEIGLSAIVNKPLFTHKYKAKGPTYKRFKHPMYISYVFLLLGVALVLGKIGYALGAITALLCLLSIAFLEDKQLD